MANKLTWMFELMDRMSGPAGKMTKALDGLEKKLKTQGDASDALHKKYKNVFGALENVGESLASVATGIAAVGLGLLAAATGAALAMGKSALEAASFRENSLVALESVLGTKDAALGALNEWEAFAAKTPWSTKDIVDWGKTIRITGLSAKDTMLMLNTVSDIGALNGFDPQKATQATQAFTHLFSLGKADMENMRQFAFRNVPLNKVFDNLGKRMHMTAAGAKLALSAGRIDATKAILAIMDTVNGKGKAGDLTAKGAQTLSGLWSTVTSRPHELFENLADSKGFDKIKEVLANIAEVLNPKSESGKNIITMLERTADKVGDMLNPLTGPEGAKTIEQFANTFVDAMGKMYTALLKLADMAGGFLGTLVKIYDMLVKMDVINDVTAKKSAGEKPAWYERATNFFFDDVVGAPEAGADKPTRNISLGDYALDLRRSGGLAKGDKLDMGGFVMNLSVNVPPGSDAHAIGQHVASAVKDVSRQAADDLFRRFLVEQGM